MRGLSQKYSTYVFIFPRRDSGDLWRVQKSPARETSDRFLHHNNAPAHTSSLLQQYLLKYSVAQLYQSPYSPDEASCDYRLDWRCRLRDIDSIIERLETNATKALKAILKYNFQECFDKWKHRYERLVQSNGDYF